VRHDVALNEPSRLVRESLMWLRRASWKPCA